jgi:MFS family permease
MAAVRNRLFYGWWIAMAAAVGIGLGGPPILVMAFPVFLKAFTKEFHASRAAVALAFSLHNLVSASASPLVGRLTDRVGIRRVILPGTVLFAALLIGNRFITASMSGIYLFNIIGGLLGLSCGPIPYSTLVSKWFDRRRGSALAVMFSGIGISAVVMPSLVQRVITSINFHAAYALYGAAMLLIAMPIVWAVLKEAPAEMGLFPDGASPASASASLSIDAAGVVGLTSREARRTSTFWILIAAIVLLGASVHACVIHLVAMLSDEGFSAQAAALASSVAGSGLLVGRVGTGFLLDRFFGPRVAMCISAGGALGIVLLLVSHGGALIFVGAFFAGLGMGAEGDVIAYLTSRYFGLKSFGEIYGYAFGSFVVAGAGGALLMGMGFDRTGSYRVPLLGFLTAIIVALVLFSRLGPYRYVPLESGATVVQGQLSAAAH